MTHPTQQELLEYAGRTIGERQGAERQGAERRGAEIALHLAECQRCWGAAAAMSAIEGALHLLPPDRPSAAFTAGVLARIGIRESMSLWWLFLRNFAPILAAGVVAGTIMMLGAGGGGGAGTGSPAGNPLFDAGLVRQAIGAGMEAFNSWTGRIVSGFGAIHITNDTLNLSVFIACLFAGIGLLDRYVFGPILRRRRQGGY